MRCIKCLDVHKPINEVYEIVREPLEAVFLDSSTRGELGKFSIIAAKPYLKLVNHGKYYEINGEMIEGDFVSFVKDYLEENKEENDTNLPIISGAVGYFSYDFGREKERVVSQHEKTLDIPECILYFYDVFIIEEHETDKLYVIANGHLSDAFTCACDVISMIENTDAEHVFSSLSDSIGRVRVNFTKEEYKTAVDNMIRYIVDGDIYVVNMTQQFQIDSECPPYEMFLKLRQNNPSPFGAFLDYGDLKIVCASPERFMQMRNGKITTRPIKGTRKRGKTKEEDEALRIELAESDKDQSELLMIVDLERNDLNRVCVPGSVNVTELFKVETYATVFHLIANIEGRIRPGCNTMDLIKAAFPGGSITGAPKLRAMELIDKEERLRRNMYTGSIGYIALNGDCDLNIVIRTAVYKDGTYHLGAGGGITCESELEFEYEETWQKAKALLDALNVRTIDGENYEYTVG